METFQIVDFAPIQSITPPQKFDISIATPLLLSVRFQDLDILTKRICNNAQDSQVNLGSGECTPLGLAVGSLWWEGAKLLLKNGANAGARHCKHTILQWAVRLMFKHMLCKVMIDDSFDRPELSNDDAYKWVQLLLTGNSAPEVNEVEQNQTGQYPTILLYAASLAGKFRTIQLLRQNYANVNYVIAICYPEKQYILYCILSKSNQANVNQMLKVSHSLLEEFRRAYRRVKLDGAQLLLAVTKFC